MLLKAGVALLVPMFAMAAAAQPGAIRQIDGGKIMPAQIDATVTRLMEAAEVAGAGIAIVNDGKVVFEKACGFRDSAKRLPLTPDSAMYAASFTKTVFAYMVMQLVQEGRLALDKPVYQYLPRPLPEYERYAELAGDARYKQITARMVLSHTSGFANLRVLEDDHKLRLHFDPGTHFAYSGEGMLLLQLVVETITGQGLEELMQRYVFQPLGMTRTSMVWQAKFDANFANEYDEYGRSLGPDKRNKADAAGSMQTTLADFSRFVAAVLNEEGLNKTGLQMLSPQVRIRTKHEFPTLQNASTTTDENDAIRLSYGLGWGLYWTPYGKAFFKEGHSDGERNYTVAFEKPKIGIVIMTNSANGEGIYKELLERLIHDRFTPIEWEGFTPYNKLPPRPPLKQHHRVALAADALERFVGRYNDPVKLPNVVITICRDGDHLTLQENEEAPQEMLPETAIDFFSANSEDTVTFAIGASGPATKIILHVDGRDITFSRMP